MNKKKIYKKLTNIKKPISIEKFITISLYDEDGYYSNSNSIGRNGDFVTSPEISQLFGEILGLYILNFWQSNIKQKFNLVELGPGKGTLLLDIIKITKKFHAFNKSMNIKLIEKNIRLVKKQKDNFNDFKLDIRKISWSKDFVQRYKEPIIIIANEFFDCLPVKQFYKKNNIWFEKMVKYDHDNKYFKLIDFKINNKNILKNIETYAPSNLLEISKSREKYFSKICKKIYEVGGMIMTIDYGYFDKPNNFSLQSVYNNKRSNVLNNIGSQDITSLVDFKSLISIAKLYSLKIDTFSTQRDFLIKHGIHERADKIIKTCNKKQEKIIINGLNRIIAKENMGSIFKVLIISK
tara:strand:+ start:2656 stop:3705 length:1050 start_codon:yes stop_codon:yes gene_type:complete